MTTEQYRLIREKLGMGSDDVARIMGISRRQVQRYEVGHAIPAPVAKLMLIMAQNMLAPAQVEELQ